MDDFTMLDYQCPCYLSEGPCFTTHPNDLQYSAHYNRPYSLSQSTYPTTWPPAYLFTQTAWYKPCPPLLAGSYPPVELHSPEVESLSGTIEPQMMYRHPLVLGPGYIDNVNMPCLKFESDSSISSPAVSPVTELSTPDFAEPWRSLPTHMQRFHNSLSPSSASSEEDEDEDEGDEDSLYDEPYAQLIYRALMQAPGHRMVLQDIYTWFQRNTLKPFSSSTGGWQNSIRHNLSMNRAFENDKSELGSSRGQRKTNSVWMLTENAIKHGVQSTTRYRKSSTSKKSNGRFPALQRQRSGAKGGIASRRTARLKRLRRQRRDLACSARAGSLSVPTRLVHEPGPRTAGVLDGWLGCNDASSDGERIPPFSYNPSSSPLLYDPDQVARCRIRNEVGHYHEHHRVAPFSTQLPHDADYGQMG